MKAHADLVNRIAKEVLEVQPINSTAFAAIAKLANPTTWQQKKQRQEQSHQGENPCSETLTEFSDV